MLGGARRGRADHETRPADARVRVVHLDLRGPWIRELRLLQRRHDEVHRRQGQDQPGAAEPGQWHLRISFDGLTPGALYRLWGNRDGLAIPGKVDGFFQIATATAFVNGSVFFDYITRTLRTSASTSTS